MQTTLQRDVLAVETHAGRVWSLCVLPALLVPAISLVYFRNRPALFVFAMAALAGIPAVGMILSGFQYRFFRDGIEVRTLGFRLCTIPKAAIVSYSIESWGLSCGGYGIRGGGGLRAYVWGNKVVHIRTTKGEVYLGHSDPERIVHHLDQITDLVSRG